MRLHFLITSVFLPALTFAAVSLSADPVRAGQDELVFDRATNSWIRKEVPYNRSIARFRTSDASPIERRIVEFAENLAPGTIVIDTQDKRLFKVLEGNKALQYAIGVGREGFTWKGTERVSRKAMWPRWTPPEEMRRREASNGRVLPATMEGGPDNPLGARALYLGSTLYRIHGTNQPWTIGRAVSSGCIRMANDDIVHLYESTNVGDKVIVR